MYLYLYDAQLSGKPFQHALVRVETRLTDLGIGGKISRLSPLKNLRELIHDEVASGVRTVVAVGDDATFLSVVNEIIPYDNVTAGFIPLGGASVIAAALGIPSGDAACDVIAARRLSRLDIGRANTTYFLSGLRVPSNQATFELDGRYHVKPNAGSFTVLIRNLPPEGWGTDALGRRFDPADGLLEMVIEPPDNGGGLFRRRRQSTPSILPCRQIKISGGKSTTVLTDGDRVLKTPVTIDVLPGKLRVIVGKSRVF
ncbi:MAG: diacylglycerol kinase family protein [bacterium]|nr:diacylglycerol kinase family protein [bacterium]